MTRWTPPFLHKNLRGATSLETCEIIKNKRFDETQRENNIFTRTLFLHRAAIYAHRNSMACYLTEIKRELISANIYSPRMEKEEKRREEGEESFSHPFHIDKVKKKSYSFFFFFFFSTKSTKQR